MDHSCGQILGWWGTAPTDATLAPSRIAAVTAFGNGAHCSCYLCHLLGWTLPLCFSYLASIPSLYLMVEPRPRAGLSVFSACSERGVSPQEWPSSPTLENVLHNPEEKHISPTPGSPQVGSVDRCLSVNQLCDQMTKRQVWTLRESRNIFYSSLGLGLVYF